MRRLSPRPAGSPDSAGRTRPPGRPEAGPALGPTSRSRSRQAPSANKPARAMRRIATSLGTRSPTRTRPTIDADRPHVPQGRDQPANAPGRGRDQLGETELERRVRLDERDAEADDGDRDAQAHRRPTRAARPTTPVRAEKQGPDPPRPADMEVAAGRVRAAPAWSFSDASADHLHEGVRATASTRR